MLLNEFIILKTGKEQQQQQKVGDRRKTSSIYLAFPI